MDNHYDEIDNLFFQYFKDHQEVPNIITNGIESAMYNRKNKYEIIELIKKIIITIVSFLTVAGGIVFAKDIKNFVINLFNASGGVNTAVENGYIYTNPEIDYCESSNTKIRINDIVMDDFNLNLSLVANYDENINLYNYSKILIPNILITDENENLIFFSNIDYVKKYYNENNITYDFSEIYNKNINSSMTLFIKDISENNANLICNLSSSDKKFPKSKTITVIFDTIILEGDDTNINLSGSWKSSISVPSQFYNRETKLYKFKSCNDSRIYSDSVTAELSKTGLKFNMKMYWGEFKEYSMEEKQKSILDTILIKNEYIENSRGEKFYPAQSSDSDGGYTEQPDGNLVYWQTFNYTTFNATNEIKIVLPTNDNKEIIFELVQ